MEYTTHPFPYLTDSVHTMTKHGKAGKNLYPYGKFSFIETYSNVLCLWGQFKNKFNAPIWKVLQDDRFDNIRHLVWVGVSMRGLRRFYVTHHTWPHFTSPDSSSPVLTLISLNIRTSTPVPSSVLLWAISAAENASQFSYSFRREVL